MTDLSNTTSASPEGAQVQREGVRDAMRGEPPFAAPPAPAASPVAIALREAL